ncbi:Unknown protein sequence [Pseudomonas amygdali pv. lachrymans]|nr:Unknown protein sequence [Pseudomonas amygdali pv. lachrymans]
MTICHRHTGGFGIENHDPARSNFVNHGDNPRAISNKFSISRSITPRNRKNYVNDLSIPLIHRS